MNFLRSSIVLFVMSHCVKCLKETHGFVHKSQFIRSYLTIIDKICKKVYYNIKRYTILYFRANTQQS